MTETSQIEIFMGCQGPYRLEESFTHRETRNKKIYTYKRVAVLHVPRPSFFDIQLSHIEDLAALPKNAFDGKTGFAFPPRKEMPVYLAIEGKGRVHGDLREQVTKYLEDIDTENVFFRYEVTRRIVK